MLTITLDTAHLERTIAGVAEGLRDLTPVWQDVRDIYIDFIKEQFKSEGSYANVKWEKLSDPYAKWKATHLPGKGILRGATDDLFESLTKPGHPQQVFTPAKEWMDWGTRVFYGRYHQTGTKRMPRRVVIAPMTQAEGERVTDALAAYLFKRARKK